MSGIAVLGLACRLPGAADVAAFRDNLVAGRASFGPVPAQRWDRALHPVPPVAGFVDGVDRFDHAYFGITPREARLMDPQQRLLLEEAVHCVEDAGVAPGALRAARTAVFVAAMGYDYYQNVSGAPGAVESHGAVGVHLSLLANRVSHVFGLRGESVALDAACAGSLVALHQARRALLAGECDYALVGAVNLNLNPWRLAAYGAGHLLSPGGGSAAFDAGADGFVPGEGVVVLLLRRQAEVEAGQRVRGVLLGSATGHVGGGLALTAPSIAAERDVIERAAEVAGVALGTVGYVEAHGTGTSLGDPIEVEALNQAFAGVEPGGCLVGSVKTNIGHLEGAAGLAGVAKILVMFGERRVVPTLGLRTANPLIDFEAGVMRPALAVQEFRARPGSGGRLRAGVSSFGFGGAAAHAVFEDAPHARVGDDAVGEVPFLLSAHTPGALAALWMKWQAFAATEAFAAARLEDVAGTLARGRAHARHRVALVVRDLAGLRAALTGGLPAVTLAGSPAGAPTGPLVAAVRASGGDVAAVRACLPHPAWVEAAGTVAASCAGWAPAAAAAVDLSALRRLHAGLATMDRAAAQGLLRQARALAAGNHTFRAYLEDWQRVLGARGPLVAWLATPPPGVEGRLLVLVLLTALRRLSRKWALPAAHGALGAAWGEVARLVVEGVLPDEAVLALMDGVGLEALAERVGGAKQPDVVVVVGDAGVAAGEVSGLVPVLASLWARGAVVDWEGLPFAHRTMSLPGYPFEAHRHWLPLAGAGAGAGAGADGAPVPDAGALAAAHVIDGRALVPAASMLAAMVEGVAGLKRVAFSRPVAGADAGRLVTVRQAGRVSLTLDGQEVCSAGVVKGAGAGSTGLVAVEDGRHDPAVYARFEALGYRYAAPLRAIVEVAASDSAVTCRVRCGGDVAVALEGVLQACLVAADRCGMVDSLVYPAGLESMTLGAVPGVFEVSVRRGGVLRQARGFACDVQASEVGREPWLRMEAVRFAAPARAAEHGARAHDAGGHDGAAIAPSAGVDVLNLVRAAVAAAIDVAVEEVGPDVPFAELGVDSILAADVARAIGKGMGARVPLHVFSDHATPAALARHLGPTALARHLDPAALAPTLDPAAVARHPEPPGPGGGAVPDVDVLALVREAVAASIDVAVEEVGADVSFAELGVDSILAADVARAIGKGLGVRVPLHVFSDHATPAALARHLGAGTQSVPPAPSPPQPVRPMAPPFVPTPVPAAPVAVGGCAIVGMAGRFPGAPDLDAYWDLLREGRCAIGAAPARWGASGVPGGFLDDAEGFDAAFFGISPREALLMDPQERVLLEQCWVALADAGMLGGGGERRVGVYVGAAAGDYARLPAMRDAAPDPQSLLAQLTSSLAARVAHVFDLQGPALVVDAACASSVAALQLACDALARGEVDAAVAAGVTVMSTPALAGMARAAGLLSERGVSRALCADADGMVLGEGVGVVVLRRAAGCGPAYAVIRAAVMRHDGARLGLSAPSAMGQVRLQRAALAAAGVDAGSVGFVETHGVGTPGGDAAELSALEEVLEARRVPLGAVKNAIGHTQSAAGMASLFKVVLQMRHGELAPTPGAGGALAEGAAGAVAAVTPWNGPRLALVNTFALNGSNGALVVEGAPEEGPVLSPVPGPAPGPALVMVGARSEGALRRRMGDLAAWLERRPVALADLALTLGDETGMPWRAVAVAEDVAGLVALWRAASAGAAVPGVRLGQAQRRAPEAQVVMDRVAGELLGQARVPGALLAAAELLVGGVQARVPVPEGARRVLGLPPYPFERVRFWPGEGGAAAAVAPVLPVSRAVPGSLAGCVAQVLRMEAVPEDVPLLSLGLDSLLAQELRHVVVKALAVDLPAAAWMEGDLQGLARQVAAAPPVARQALAADRAASHAPFPLTEMQAAYVVGRSAAVPLGGPCLSYWEFDIPERWTAPQLEAAFARLVDVHDMLRAVVDGEGRQRVLPDVPRLVVAEHDWRGRDAAAPLAALRAAFSQTGFDPAVWPLARIAVSRDDAGQRLHLAMDLLFVDMPSLVLLLRQWAELMAGGPAPRPPALSFRDAVLGRREQPAAAAYWAREAAGLPGGPELPGQKRVEAGAVWHSTRLSAWLEPAAWQGFRARAGEAGVTPATALVAAFGEVLAHWTLAKRFTLNLTTIDRAPDVADVVGDFTGTVLLGLDHAAALPFAERARAVRERLGAHLAHAGYSGVRVLRDLSQARRAAVAMPVVFTSMLGHAGLESMGRLVGGVTRTPQVWLDCHVRESGGGLAVSWDVAEGLFPSGMLGAMLEAYAGGLRRLAAGTWAEPLGGWVAGEAAARRARVNATSAALPEGLLHDALLARAAEAPERVAVVDASGPHSYGELVALATRVAARVAVRPDELVAVAIPRGWRQVAALLGVLMAGGAYLPIDPALPAARVRALLDRGRARTVLVPEVGGDWPAGVEVLGVDALPQVLPQVLPQTVAAPRRAGVADLAYVLFTSGSTGEPKGVMIEHRAALNTVQDVNARFGIGAEDRVLALSAASFDLSVWDVFGVLGAGGTVVVPDERRLADPAYLAGLVAAHAVTVWNGVPAFAQLLMEGGPARGPASHVRASHVPASHALASPALATLRLVMMSGDWIPPALPGRLQAAIPGVRVVSLGGATEASIWSVSHDVGVREPGWASVPYGRPMQNQTCHVLDAAMDDVPDWAPGELYIGGAGVARGYWRDEARTAERFLAHPRTGERLYRTGDLARYREDGLLEFLGRADHQVKLGGHRVELGEVEAALARHPLVSTAVAVAPFDGPGRRLAAFCVAAAGTAASGGEIQRFVRGLLPGYMVPAEVRVVAALPLGAQGKVDRRALEAMASAPSPVDGAPPDVTPLDVAPLPGDVVGRVLAIWRAVLGDPALPADGNLFEHGATSFKAVEACARLSREVAACTVTDVFEFPTVRDLAARLSGPATAAVPAVDDTAARADRRRAFRAALQGGGA